MRHWAYASWQRQGGTGYVDVAPEGRSNVTEVRDPVFRRINGGSRIGTAIAISNHAFHDPVESVDLARADVFVDAVAGCSLVDVQRARCAARRSGPPPPAADVAASPVRTATKRPPRSPSMRSLSQA